MKLKELLAEGTNDLWVLTNDDEVRVFSSEINLVRAMVDKLSQSSAYDNLDPANIPLVKNLRELKNFTKNNNLKLGELKVDVAKLDK
jgi:hypothetical protein